MTKRAVVHVEIPATSGPDTAKFYSQLFGWEMQEMDGDNYIMWQSGNLGGGFPTVDGKFSQPDRVLIYIDSADINADLKKIEAAGGKAVQPKTDIPGMGWWAAFKDPTGNTIGLFEAQPKS